MYYRYVVTILRFVLDKNVEKERNVSKFSMIFECRKLKSKYEWINYFHSEQLWICFSRHFHQADLYFVHGYLVCILCTITYVLWKTFLISNMTSRISQMRRKHTFIYVWCLPRVNRPNIKIKIKIKHFPKILRPFLMG